MDRLDTFNSPLNLQLEHSAYMSFWLKSGLYLCDSISGRVGSVCSSCVESKLLLGPKQNSIHWDLFTTVLWSKSVLSTHFKRSVRFVAVQMGNGWITFLFSFLWFSSLVIIYLFWYVWQDFIEASPSFCSIPVSSSVSPLNTPTSLRQTSVAHFWASAGRSDSPRDLVQWRISDRYFLRQYAVKLCCSCSWMNTQN